MRSSIFNFDCIDDPVLVVLRKAIIALLVSALALVVAIEFGTRAFVYRISKNLSRIHQEAIAASQIRTGGDGIQNILLVGNSLLLHDVDTNELSRSLRPNQIAQQFAIQATTYYDWYFGVRGLLENGANPDLIIICFEPRHILLSSVRSEMFAYYLMQWKDLLEVRRRLDTTGSETFDLLLANKSIFYALRKELRQVLFQRLIPNLPQLTSMIARAPKPMPDSNILRTIGKERLGAIQELGRTSSATISLLLMPPIRSDSLAAVKEVGEEIGMQVLVPLTSDEIMDEDYQPDGYHLSDLGRKKFTKALAPLLMQMRE